MASNKSIVISQSINASKAAIFPMLVEGDKLSRWFPSRAESDPVVGGNYMFSFEFLDPIAAEKKNHMRRGTFSEIVPNDRVRYSWELGNTEVEIVLVEKNGVTDVTLTHSGWKDGDENQMNGHNQGWTFFLQNLKDYLENGRDTRAEVMGMASAAHPAVA